jgi:Mrp family chromosome partitioning ATPase
MTGATFARAFDKLLSDVTTSFDVVLIDSPPLLESADATTLGNAADGLVIVVGTRDLVRDHVQVTERLELIETDVVGYIVNRQTVRPADRRDAEPSSLVESAPQLGGTLQQARP